MSSTLIERLEQATGPDRALDWELHVIDGLEGVGMYGAHPKYTASIDAARMLVPDGRGWVLKTVARGCEARVGGIPGGDFEIHGAEAPTAAVALCIAALKARRITSGEGQP